MQFDIECNVHRDLKVHFRVEIQTHALDDLITDALAAYRVYEMMVIRRPGDLWKYLWVKTIEVPDSIVDSMTRKRRELWFVGTIWVDFEGARVCS